MTLAPLHERATLIVGAGYLGGALAAALAPQRPVIILRRRAGPTTTWSRDVSRPFELPPAPRLDAVVYLVGADDRTPAAYRAAYEDGPRHLLAALEQAGQRPRRFLYASSTSVYGQVDGETVDETSPTEPTAFSGAAVLAGERMLAASGLAVTRVRFAGIYGPGRDSFVRGVAAGRFGLTTDDPYMNRIHRDDGVGILTRLLDDGPMPPVVLAADPAPARRNDVVRWLAAALDREPAIQTVASARRPRGGHRRCEPAWLLADGYRYHHPDYRSGYADLVAAIRDGAPG